jgi:predicted phosphoribosyltransferase
MIRPSVGMGTLLEELDLSGKTGVFPDRQEAGRFLAQRLSTVVNAEGIVLAIPAGGVPVAWEIAKALGLPMDILIVRKIQIPGNTEAGFGSLGPEGEILLNESLLQDLHLSRKEIEEQVAHTREILKQREARFRKGRPFPELKGKQVILVDDGLASGYTMLAAISFVRHREAREIVVAVPTASRRTVAFLLPKTDTLVCPNIRGGPTFAVADAYQDWYDLADEEVLGFLDTSGTDNSPAP